MAMLCRSPPDSVPTDRPTPFDVEPDLGQRLACRLTSPVRIENPNRTDLTGNLLLPTEEEIAINAHLVDDGEILVDNRDAQLDRIGRRRDRDSRPIPPKGASVGLVHAGQDLDQGRLARAVVTKEREHLPRSNTEVHAAKRLHRAERLSYTLGLDAPGVLHRGHRCTRSAVYRFTRTATTSKRPTVA